MNEQELAALRAKNQEIDNFTPTHPTDAAAVYIFSRIDGIVKSSISPF